MPDISKIKMPSGTVYDIKDEVARSQLGGAMRLLGTTTTALTDGATTNPIMIGGVSTTAGNGDCAIYNNKEFVFNGTHWYEFGDLTGLGSLAFKNSASGSVAVPATYTSTATFTGKAVELKFTGSSSSVNVSGTPSGSVAETKSKVTVSKASSGTTTYTPSGTISTGTGTANYTPAGSVAVSSAGSTTTVKNPTKKTVVTDVAAVTSGSAVPSGQTEIAYISVDSTTETLTFNRITKTTGDSITTADVTVKTGDASYSFSGTGANLKFTGEGARLETDSQVLTGASFSGSSSTFTGSVTPSGTISEGTGTANYTPEGTVSVSTTTATTESKTVTVS